MIYPLAYILIVAYIHLSLATLAFLFLVALEPIAASGPFLLQFLLLYLSFSFSFSLCSVVLLVEEFM